jgi:GH43 family beta-xylosidase
MAVNDQKWEGPLVEGPSVVVHDGRIHLFYSANWWDTADYSIVHVVCGSITGPCEKDPGPFLASGDEYSGPGGQEFFTDRAGQLWMAFHAWLPGEVGYDKGGQRRLFLERIEFDDSGAPQLAE